MNLLPKKTRCITLLILILTSVLATFLFMQKAKAEVKIISITPASGYVGTNVTLTANITTSDGEYEIWFNGNQLVSGNAVGNSVTTSIIIPPAPSGSHNLTIVDVGSGENNTATFEILTKYLLEISPLELPMQQRQEGDFVEIFVNITGGTSKTLYVTNITVQAPNNASHPKLLDLPTSDDGSASATIEYPNTSYVGEYKVFFNGTLATTSFTIGLTNATEYHRFQVVDIKALYAPSENVTLTITKGDYFYSENLTADENGIIYYTNWAVPANATVNDTYIVNITSIEGITTKNPPDIQNFTVPGFDVNIIALNLAEEPLPDVTIQIFENETSVVNATSGSDGLASVKLEIGNYTANVYFKKTLVGEHWINVTESSLSFDVTCNLTNLKVLVLTVVDEKEYFMPEVRLSLSPENLTSTPNLNTNITGLGVFHNLFLDVTYTLNASRYETQFNTTTIYGLLQNGNPVAWFDLTIYCPIYTLQVNVTNPNANNQPINNALVKIREVMGGLHFEDSTTTDGTAVFNSPLGKYIVEVYGNGIKLNETIVLLNESLIKLPISCKFYGLNIGIQVVDYFGQPIPKANVTLLRNGLENSTFTLPDGRAEFLGLIGGNLTVAIYLPGQLEPYTVSPFYVDSSKTIQIRIERYTMLAGFLVETSHLVMSIIIVVSLIVLLFLEVYRRRRLKPKTSKSES